MLDVFLLFINVVRDQFFGNTRIQMMEHFGSIAIIAIAKDRHQQDRSLQSATVISNEHHLIVNNGLLNS